MPHDVRMALAERGRLSTELFDVILAKVTLSGVIRRDDIRVDLLGLADGEQLTLLRQGRALQHTTQLLVELC